MYKKIYLEVTNNCNLNCDFCLKNERLSKFISIDEYKIILSKIKGYTKYLYLHVAGEPLLHPNINELINIGSKDYYINITTNGYLINKIIDNHNIRQINISMHSFNPLYIKLDNYLNNICNVIDSLSKDTYISLRFWVNNNYSKDMIDYLSKRYNKDIKLETGFKIKDNVFISIEDEFIWPELHNNNTYNKGMCYALKDHIGILVDGTIVPCCLDIKGIIKLGNIFNTELDSVINSKRYIDMLEGFKNNKRVEILCQNCNFNH